MAGAERRGTGNVPRGQRRGLFNSGESNLVDPLSSLFGFGGGGQAHHAERSRQCRPRHGTIVKAAGRQALDEPGHTRPHALEAIDDYLTSAISGDTLNQFALFEEMEEKWPELRLALFKHKLKAARRNPRIVPPDLSAKSGRWQRRSADCVN